ncbi:MAG TPA: PilC/PilY family type IV pilus protein [Gammaproteobacteria bacterium]|nr:PilC/PilY family type IV pilus protein [Gammaproteobacteria bacterium]
MKLANKRLLAFAAGAAWALVWGRPAVADDIELFVGSGTPGVQARPNILLILDDSGSMSAQITSQTSYDPTHAYTGGGCDKNRVYWSTTGTPPVCGTGENAYFMRSGLKCHAALDAFAAASGGTYRDVLASYDGGTQKRWEALSTGDHNRQVECAEDWGKFGDEPTATGAAYPRNGDTARLWTADSDNRIAWGSNPTNNTYWLYDGNWLAWYYSPAATSTRMQVVKDVANNLVSTINGVNVGLMHFIDDGSKNGGNVLYALEDISTARNGMRAAIDSLVPNYKTPLSETLYEATKYLMGGSVEYGAQSGAPQSIAASRRPSPDQNLYKSPIAYSCQKNYIVYLTDGEPSEDHDADSKIVALADATGKSIKDIVGSISGNQCDVENYPPPWSPDGGQCLDDLAQFLHDGDLSSMPGRQSVVTHTVGFGLNGSDLPVLRETAARGGGNYYEASNTASLTTALSDIITKALDTQATFTSPTVAVNSFNRTQNLNDLYISLFEPSSTRHWPGNLKKYKLRPTDGVIVDVNGNPAINPATGLMFPSARSFWSVAGEPNDGSDVELGGAARRIPTSRNVYTYLGASNDLTDPSNALAASNDAVDDALLGTGSPDLPTRAEVIDFINGRDAADNDNDGDKSEPRFQMGDPLHSQALSMVYGPTLDDTVIFFATNDGFLHAIDAKTGVEKWAFVPPEFLSDQTELFLDSLTAQKGYGVDGSLRLQAIGDNDGIVKQPDGERVYLFFGMRRGGDALYALDVTLPASPKVLWHHDSTTLPGVGQSWSSAVPTRIDVGGASQNSNKLVVVVGGGYDASQDGDSQADGYSISHPGAKTVTDDAGNSLYILDSVTGTLLWHGSKDGRDKDFNTADRSMDYSIPADVKVVDLDGDNFADRMYAADMGGQIWRFDIHNGKSAAALVTGGVIAQLGGAPNADTALADVRRFYNSPDVAVATDKQTHSQFVHVGIGSGHRVHPLSLDNSDRFYALRDRNLPLGFMTQSQFDAITPTTDADLVAITSASTAVSQDAKGWKLELNAAAGEKVLAEARTFNNAVLFTTYTPAGSAALTDPCVPALGTNRLYVMNLFNGAPVTNLDQSAGNGPLTFSDISRVTGSGSISPGVTFLFPSNEGSQSPQRPAPVACVDFFCLPANVLTGGNFGVNPVRTFWSQGNLD